MPGLREALVDAMADRKWPVFIYGAAGRGKSYALACIRAAWGGLFANCDEWTGKVIRARTAPDRRIYDDGAQFGISESRLFERVSKSRVVFFDDVGIRGVTDAAFAIFYQFVDSRNGKPTFYSSNLGPRELAEVFDDRIVSRMCAGSVIHVKGKDRRMQGVKIREVEG